MSEIFQIKYQFIFGGYLSLACAIGAIFQLALVALRERNRKKSRPHDALRVPLIFFFAALVAGVDLLRGIGVIGVPQFANYTPVYRPEAIWYLTRAMVTIAAVLAFHFLETTVYSRFVNRPAADDALHTAR